MQHDHVLKMLNFDRGGAQALYQKPRLICFIFVVPLPASDISVKILTTDLVIEKIKCLTFDPT